MCVCMCGRAAVHRERERVSTYKGIRCYELLFSLFIQSNLYSSYTTALIIRLHFFVHSQILNSLSGGKPDDMIRIWYN